MLLLWRSSTRICCLHVRNTLIQSCMNWKNSTSFPQGSTNAGLKGCISGLLRCLQIEFQAVWSIFVPMASPQRSERSDVQSPALWKVWLRSGHNQHISTHIGPPYKIQQFQICSTFTKRSAQQWLPEFDGIVLYTFYSPRIWRPLWSKG